ncbi:MAG: DUF1476 domain-containing protein [Parvularcula sp.]|jgi:hypothetical protein|nr:DUF1476 domain-containing protein [Parvularcula sp.]
MTTFNDRERRFEAEFANNQELRFKVEAKRDRLVAAWAAEKLGKTGAEVEEYAKTVIRADLAEPGDEDVFRKLRADLPKEAASDEEIRQAMKTALAEAMESMRG